jgi:hypothetical protein
MPKEVVAFVLGVLLFVGIIGELFIAEQLSLQIWIIATVVAIQYLAAGLTVGWQSGGLEGDPFWGAYMALGFTLVAIAAQIAGLVPSIIPQFREIESAAVAGPGLMGVCFLAFVARQLYGDRNSNLAARR